MPKENLTDRRLKTMKAAQEGERYEISDGIMPGLAVRVTDKGKKTFVLVARFPGSKNPTRRALGEYGAITLDDARQKARDWHDLIHKGIDPKLHEEEQKAREGLRRENTFGVVVEEYLRLAVIGPDETKPLQRRGLAVARELRDEFVNDKIVGGRKRTGLNKRPLESITKADILHVIDDAVARGAKYQAFNLLGHVRTFFNWAIGRGIYGIDMSPCDRMRPKVVIGKKLSRKRVLSNLELAAYWRAAGRMGYPYGPLFRLLAVTGQRKSEVAEAPRYEFDLSKKLWTIPPERMKADSAHMVPLSDLAVSILESAPTFKKGIFIFSATGGKKPVNSFSKAKQRLDCEMLKSLRAYARKSGGDPRGVKLEPFVIHDVRRTMRTGLSSLPVASIVAELVIAHTQKGLHAVYDQHAYLDEKRHALDLWAGRLRDMTSPTPDNVVPLLVPTESQQRVT
jgi:integrase